MAGMRVVRIVFGVAVACAACTTFSEGIPSETTDAGTGADGGPGSTKDAEPNEATTGERDAGDAKQGTAAEYFQLVKSDGPQAYWRMGDVAGSTAAQDSIADNDALLSPTAQPVFGNPGLFPGTGSLTFNGQSYSYSYVTGTLPIDNIALTLEAWIRLDSPADSEYRHIAFAGSQSLSYGSTSTTRRASASLASRRNRARRRPSGRPMLRRRRTRGITSSRRGTELRSRSTSTTRSR